MVERFLRTWPLGLLHARRRILAATVLGILPASFFCISPAHAEIIDAIRIEGTQRIEPATVQSYLGLRAGDDIDQEKMDEAVKRLFNTGLFADVNLSDDAGTLVVSIKENPIINSINFVGNKEMETDDLTKELQLRPRVVYTRTKVQADTARILDIYRRSGRFGANVEPKIVELDQNRVDLTFVITEGAKTGVERINFVGNHAFSDSDLRDAISTRESRWWRVLSNSDFYDPDRTNYDRELLRRYYLNNGYADFRVLSAVAELTPSRKDFYLTFTMEEGDRYTFGSVKVETTIKNFETASLEPLIVGQTGEVYNASQVEDTVNALTKAVGDRQYAFAQIDPQVVRNRDTKTIDIVYHINEGPRVFIGKINIHGNERTYQKVIRRELLLAEGDPYNASKIKRSEQKIKDLGFFDDVKVTPSKGAAADESDLDVSLKEKPTGEVSVGAGYSTTDGLLGDFSLSEKNLLGRGQTARFSTTISQRSQQYDISFTEPYFLDRDLAAGFDLYHTKTDNQTSSSYDESDNGVSPRISYPLSENLRQRLNYTFTHTKIDNVDSDASRFIRDQEGVSNTSLVGQELTYDNRDSKLDPTTGWQLKYGTDFAGVGGDVKFLRHRASASYYTPFFDPEMILNIRAEAGWVMHIGSDDIRINDRFFIGGDTFRGFEFAGIGPRDMTDGTKDALGGNKFARGTVELGFPTGLPKELGIQGHVFSDMGSLWDVDATPEPGEVFRDDRAFRMSVGVGISWQSPFGPIRFDLAKPVMKQPYDETETIHFSFGTDF